MMFFRVFPVAVALLLTCFVTLADEAGKEHQHEVNDAHKQNVEQMLVLMGVPEQVDSSAKEVVNLYLVKVKEDEASQKVKNLVNQYRAEVRQLVEKTISWKAVREQYIQSYADQLSSRDVEAIKEFIDSSAGKNFIVGQKLANSEIQQVNKQSIQFELTEPISELSQKLRSDLATINQASKG